MSLDLVPLWAGILSLAVLKYVLLDGFAPVPILTVLLAWLVWDALRWGREVLPFIGTMGLFFLSVTGLIISLWPYVAPPSITLWDAATAPMAQQFLMARTMFLLPVILLYVFWSNWVFRGKVRAHVGYHE